MVKCVVRWSAENEFFSKEFLDQFMPLQIVAHIAARHSLHARSVSAKILLPAGCMDLLLMCVTENSYKYLPNRTVN